MNIEADKIYQDELLDALGQIDNEDRAFISHIEGRHAAKKLLDAMPDDFEFLRLQNDMLYDTDPNGSPIRKTLYDSRNLAEYLRANGFVVEPVNADKQTGTAQICIYRNTSATPSTNEYSITAMTEAQLPEYSEDFYTPNTEKRIRRKDLPFPSRVLNIGSGHDERKQIPDATNVDVSSSGKPDVVATAANLPFPDDHFTVVLASHVLEHFSADQIPDVLREWKRVLHPRGLLRIAVPDATITLNELHEGTTAKGDLSFTIPGGTAPLTQALGLGSEHSETDYRWLHRILFSKSLLATMLREVDMNLVGEYDQGESLSYLSNLKTDEINRYSLRVEAMNERSPHTPYPELTENEYLDLVKDFDWSNVHGVTIVVPVRNESALLPSFLINLQSTLNELERIGIPQKVRFVINGSTDNSRNIIQDYISNARHSAELMESREGIKNALHVGATDTTNGTFLAKVDVDTTFDYWTLPLLVKDLLENQKKIVTYAEALPNEQQPNRFNMAEFYQDFRTQRLYYHGRFSAYRINPFELFPADTIVGSTAHTEDMMLSCLIAYYFGLDAMGAAPGAVVRSGQPSSIDMLIRKFDRSRQEISKIEEVFPQLTILSSVLKRVETLPDNSIAHTDPIKYEMWKAYHSLHSAMTAISRLDDGVTSEASGWERLR